MKNKLHPEYFIFKYMWLILLIPKQKYVFLIFLLNLFFLIFKYKNVSNSLIRKKYFLSLLIWTLVSLISFSINYSSEVHLEERFFADLTAPIIWLMGSLYYYYYTNIYISFKKIKAYIKLNTSILLLISLLYIFYDDNIVFLGRNLKTVDYLTDTISYRLVGFMEYPTIISLICFVLLPLVFIIKNKTQKIVYLLILSIPPYLAGSRIIIFSVLMFSVFYIIFYFNIYKYRKYIYCVFFFSIVIFFINQDSIIEFFYNIYNYRSSSNIGRNLIYFESINEVINGNFMLGYNISKYSSVGPWLGSHSTYIYFFYKTGFIGLFFIILAHYYFFEDIVKKNRLMYIYIFVILVFYLYETIDPIIISILLLFSNIGLSTNKFLKENS